MAASYPFKKYNYKVEIDGITAASFSEVSGFDATIDVIEYRTGDEGVNYARKTNGLTKYGNVTLKWGMTSSMEFYEWVTAITNGESMGADKNKDVTITLFDDDGNTSLAVWNLTAAWPSKYTAPDFNATSSEIAFESVELVFESMLRES
ncbi:MAG: phage tail protein [Eubacteriales bacterium]